MQDRVGSVEVQEIALTRWKTGDRFEGIVFTGPGREVVERISRETGQSGTAVLDAIVHRLLVKKGADWTSAILSEYLGLYDDSSGTFSLVWDKASRQLVAHGSSFQSRTHNGAALVGHIRTDDAFRGLGFGTIVTEKVTAAAFQEGAWLVVLGTDDKRHRIEQGERAAYSMYAKLGYAILAEKELTDTVEWLMVVDRPIFQRCQEGKQAAGGRLPGDCPDFRLPGDCPNFRLPGDCPNFRLSENGTVPLGVTQGVRQMQQALIESVRGRFSRRLDGGQASPVSDGDMANLFLLTSLCPPDDFRMKLTPWGVHLGPEMERSYLVNVRPAITDRDRLDDASLALRDGHGVILAVCAARRASPFTRNTMEIDFYCLPQFLAANRPAAVALVEAVLSRIEQSPERPATCRVVFSGIDPEKLAVFDGLGFVRTNNAYRYFTADGKPAFQACECEKTIV